MSAAPLRRASAWLPTFVVLVVVFGAGARLLALNVQERTRAAHETAERVAARAAHALELKLEALASAAAKRTSSAGAFAMSVDGGVVSAPAAQLAIARSLASEWAVLDAHGALGRPGLIGPLRLGSQWVIAARAPLAPVQPVAGARARWSVAYAELDQLLLDIHLGRIARDGYDFALTAHEPGSADVRAFASSASGALSDPESAPVRAPNGFPQLAGEELRVQIQPRAGWYPMSALVAGIGLLAVVSWLLAFGAHDLTHSIARLRAALESSKRQLRTVHQQLSAEIANRQNLQQSFEHARYHDAFTGLPNRRYFMDHLDRALREVRSGRRRIAVVLIDIDRFRLINDTLGHTAGDELMVQAARRFQMSPAAAQCVLARWGGDQFALLIPEVHSSEDALGIASALQATLREPVELRRHRLTVTARAGATVVEAGPLRAEDVLREADIALSADKKADSGRPVAYVPAMGGQAASLVSLEADLHLALERRELELLFQPIVELHTRHMIGAEALLRWRHPVEGLLRPERFLGIAEEAGLMVPITHWIVRRACRLAGEWRRRLPPRTNFFISVNLSATALRDPQLGDELAGALSQMQTPSEALKFELSEGGLVSDVGAAREQLERLRSMGIQLMLDDFGTGYSSLNYLQLFPFDFVKIDRPLHERIPSEAATVGIMTAMLQIAASLGLTPIAETVETQAAAQALEQMGCNFGQGYFFSGPVTAEEALQCLRGEDRFQPGRFEPEPAGQWTDDSPTLLLPAAADFDDPKP